MKTMQNKFGINSRNTIGKEEEKLEWNILDYNTKNFGQYSMNFTIWNKLKEYVYRI